jgi:hypothetical protein
MKKPVKITLLVVFFLLIGLVLAHLVINNLLPYIQTMHSGMY